ncbi:hypothetical protein Q8F55_004743 [Vanrija albida]|uniref:Zn(2)-C6 fungal-type domain-containing protein n=1 Tax=Vanrija albida TaxID=181172 RepID=A0ABR3PZS3_9TREE
MARPSWHTEDSVPPAAKRQKLFRACAACVSSKTRCEDVTPEGCSLCRRRGKPCSLSGVAAAVVEQAASVGVSSSQLPSPSHQHHQSNHHHHAPPPTQYRSSSSSVSWASPSAAGPGPSSSMRPAATSPLNANAPSHPSPSEVDELRGRVADAERRVARTEAALAELEARVKASAASDSQVYRRPANGASREDTSFVDLPREGPFRLATSSLLIPLDETIFSVSATRAYPNPVERGVISPATVELAWHGFKAKISALLPLPPFLAVSTPVPAHGFVVTAALHHVPSAHSPGLAAITAECLLMAMSGNASVDVVLALLILSLAPERPDDEDKDDKNARAPRPPSPYRLISLAYSMGQNLGLESVAEAALRRGNDLNHESWNESLWRLQLWAAVVNRFALLSLMYGQTIPPQLVAPRLPPLARDSVEACNRHLRAEAKLVEIFRPVAVILCSLEHRDDEYSIPLINELHDRSRASFDAADAFIRNGQPPSLCNDAKCIEFALCLRMGSLTFWIPSPLRDAREAVLRCLNGFGQTMRSMLDVMLGPGGLEPSHLPAYAVHLLSTAQLCFRRAVRYVLTAYPQANPPLIEVSRLDEAEQTLRKLGASPRFLFDHAKPMGNLNPAPSTDALANGDAAGAGAPGTALFDFDIMNWDLSFLYPDLSAAATFPMQM